MLRLESDRQLTPSEHLAADDVLFTTAERSGLEDNVLRVWEPSEPMVVLGRGSRVAAEVDQAACLRDHVAIRRRTSGGAAVLTGPGCLMYSLVLRHADQPRLATIDRTHTHVLGTLCEALNETLARNVPGTERSEGRLRIAMAGTSDLTVSPYGASWNQRPTSQRKVSGNSMRRGRAWTLYHGTLLYDFDLDAISRYLLTAPRQPAYRTGRDHGDFVANLGLSRNALIDAVQTAWSPVGSKVIALALLEEITSLANSRYAQAAWNLRH